MVDHPVWAVVVARIGQGAKSRLAGSFGEAQRRTLALAMLTDVLDVCAAARDLLAGTLAVVDHQAAREVALRRGAKVVADPGSGDMNAAVAAGLRAARESGATTALVLPGDIPLLSIADLYALVDAAGEATRAVVIGSSHDGQGTNALVLRPPDVIAPAFGPPSVERHRQAALSANAVARIRPDLGLARDVDTPADVLALASAAVGPHTARALGIILGDRTASLTRL